MDDWGVPQGRLPQDDRIVERTGATGAALTRRLSMVCTRE